VNIAGLIDQLARQGVQLWFEGNRLRFRGPRGALTAEQRAQLGAHRDAVIAELRLRSATTTRLVPLSYGQRSLWVVHQDEPGSAAYNVAFAVAVSSALDRAALRQAMQALVDRHAILRTTYPLVDGRPTQHIAGAGVALLDFHEVPALGDEELHERVHADYARPFDLVHGPLLRTTVFTRGPLDHVLLITAHHIALDGWSVLLLLDEMRKLYVEQTRGTPADLVRPELEYSDYTTWQARLLASPEGEALARYWERKLAAPRAEVEIPADRARPTYRSLRGATFDFRFDAELSSRLSRLARDEGTTLFVLMLAAFKVLLYRYSGTEDVVVGTPTLGRNRAEFGRILGHFVNAVPLRSRVTADMPFRTLMDTLRRTLLEAIDAQEYPLALMVERLQPTRDSSRSPLFETMFVLQRFEQFRELSELLSAEASDTPADFGGLQVRRFAMHQQEGQFDLGLGLVEHGDTLTGALNYNTDLFDASSMRRLADHYCNLLRGIVADPQARVGQLPLLDAAERQALCRPAAWAAQPALAMHERFEAQVERDPHAIALCCDGERLDYGELNRRANRLAHRLRELDVRPGTLVGLRAERSIDLVVGLIGILKSGGAYLPIDLAYPADRVAFMLEDAQAPVVVTQRALLDQLPAHRAVVVCVDDAALAGYPQTNPPPAAGPDDLIYVIFTSGSTGKPKGTLLTHRAVDRLLQATQPWFGFGPTDVWTLFHSVAFDFSVWELWGALACGGRLVVVPYWVSRAPDAFLDLLRQEGVTVLNQTPSAFRQLVQAELASGPARPTALRWVVFGGEALELQSLRPWFDRHGDNQPRLVNMYGITETCVHVSYRPITRADLDSGCGSVIGVPIPDLTVRVLDAALEPTPVGVVGEMYVGGPGLARGYLNRPELTCERFIADPFQAGQRLYRTGDLARRRADGDLEYIGRIDQQVKIRGFRIELGEIESALARHPRVRQTAVLARSDPGGSTRLIAYVAPAEGEPLDASALREHLRASLPEYMLPAHFVFLATLPLTTNNKVDVKALPEPEDQPATSAGAHVEPRTTLEFQLLALWRQVLGVDSLGTRDNFFDHGGHSLIAVELLSRIEQVYGRKLPLATLFQAPSVAQMADVLIASDWSASWRSLVAINPLGSAVPIFLVPGVGGNVLMFGKLSKLLGADQPLFGLQARGLDGKEEPFRSIADMAQHYVVEIQSARPKGPYFIGGTCTGGVIAYEVAQRLIERGEDVRLVMLETWPPATARIRGWTTRALWPAQYLWLKLVGYGKELIHLPLRQWPEFVRRKLRTGRAVFDVGLKETLGGSTYYVEKVVDATLHAVARYEPRPYAGGLLNVIAINRPLPTQAVDTRRTWEKLAQGKSEAVMVPAEDSGRLFISPHVEVVAEILRNHAAQQFQAAVAPRPAAASAASGSE
jgi:amino acid adenylation domain-containing protein